MKHVILSIRLCLTRKGIHWTLQYKPHEMKRKKLCECTQSYCIFLLTWMKNVIYKMSHSLLSSFLHMLITNNRPNFIILPSIKKLVSRRPWATFINNKLEKKTALSVSTFLGSYRNPIFLSLLRKILVIKSCLLFIKDNLLLKENRRRCQISSSYWRMTWDGEKCLGTTPIRGNQLVLVLWK